MSNQYEWEISALEVIPQVDGRANQIITSHWSCARTDSDGNSGRVYATFTFPDDQPKGAFKPYDQLTKDEVIQWTKDALGEEQVSAIYQSIDAQIQDQISPKIITPALPWA